MNETAIDIEFNNENLTIKAGSTVQKMLDIVGNENDRFIIVLNGSVLNRSIYLDRILKNDDVVELITPISGG